ncbi:MAG TPA: DNA replication/repair protein RecF [Peptococcaceae bacterium]|nr:DNA replication/repair protein RecF [Peptococcaceae bacterium]HQD54237.1 DNA replication/repair protein RecF [Peptococcaceae bacterium]
MYLEKLHLTNYRNYEKLSKNFSSQINILVGANAQGKTNLLEAIYYLAIGKAYRAVRDIQLTRWEQNHFIISGEIQNKMGSCNVAVFFQQPAESGGSAGQNTRVMGSKGRKEIKINGLKVRKMADFLGNLTAVLFAPEDLNIVKGAPIERRRLLDNDISQVSPSYYAQLQQYQKVLIQRNHLLKRIHEREKGLDELEIWDLQFLKLSEEIIQKRLQVLEKLSPLTRLMQRKLTKGKENLEFKYYFNRKRELKIGNPIKEILVQEMEQVKKEEIARGMTLWGPHRDDLIISLNSLDLKLYGSQGQHRTAVLAIKLAELEFFKSESGEYPILLLDDVLSELDLERREHLIKIVQEKMIQCFITTTEDLSFLWNDHSKIASYHVEKGTLQEYV